MKSSGVVRTLLSIYDGNSFAKCSVTAVKNAPKYFSEEVKTNKKKKYEEMNPLEGHKSSKKRKTEFFGFFAYKDWINISMR